MQQVQFSVEVPGLDLLRDLLAKSAACCLQVHVSVYFFGGAWCRVLDWLRANRMSVRVQSQLSQTRRATCTNHTYLHASCVLAIEGCTHSAQQLPLRLLDFIKPRGYFKSHWLRLVAPQSLPVRVLHQTSCWLTIVVLAQ